MSTGFCREQLGAVGMRVQVPSESKCPWECDGRCVQRTDGGSVHESAGFSTGQAVSGHVSAGAHRGQSVGGEHVSADSCRAQAGNRHVVQVPTEGRVGQWTRECRCGHRPEVSRELVSTGYFRLMPGRRHVGAGS